MKNLSLIIFRTVLFGIIIWGLIKLSDYLKSEVPTSINFNTVSGWGDLAQHSLGRFITALIAFSVIYIFYKGIMFVIDFLNKALDKLDCEK